MKIEELKDEPFFALFAPDGSFQCMTLAPDFPSCCAQIKMLHKAGLCKSMHQLLSIEGSKILPVFVSIRQCGTEDDVFKVAHN